MSNNSSGRFCQHTKKQPYRRYSRRFHDNEEYSKTPHRHCRSSANPSNLLRRYQLFCNAPIFTKEGSDSTIKVPDPKLLLPSEINKSIIRQHELNRYQRIRQVSSVRGFVVNIHDATNFDIDLEIPDGLNHLYRDVIRNEYSYLDVSPIFGDIVDEGDSRNLRRSGSVDDRKLVISKTYRCRLKGIAINKIAYNNNANLRNTVLITINQLIDRSDGWVVCTLSDIDVYQRLLVDITIHTPTQIINLKEHLLRLMADSANPIFYPYSQRRQS